MKTRAYEIRGKSPKLIRSAWVLGAFLTHSDSDYAMFMAINE